MTTKKGLGLTFTRTLEYQVASFEPLQDNTRSRLLTVEDIEEAFSVARATDRILRLHNNGAVTESGFFLPGERASTHGPMHRRIVR